MIRKTIVTFEEDIPDPIEFSEEICEAKRRYIAQQIDEAHNDNIDADCGEFEI